MSPLRIALARVHTWFRGRQLDRDLRDEISSHLDEAVEESVRRGLSPTDARRAALLSFGGVSQTEERHREARSFLWLDHLRRDLRHAGRGLRRSAGFSVVVLVVLAVGTGAVTAVFALLESTVLRRLPFPNSDQIVAITHTAPGLDLKTVGLSSGVYFHYRQHAQAFTSLAVYKDGGPASLSMPGAAAERVHVTYTGAEVFRVLGATPERGRLFTEEDGRPGFMNMKWAVPILLAHDFWIDHLGGDPAVVGRTLTIGDNPRKVIGVLPAGFAFPDAHTQIWMLLEVPNSTSHFARSFEWNAIARLRPGTTAAAAEVELVRVLPQIQGAYDDATPERLAEVRLAPIVTPLKAVVIGDIAEVLWTLLGGMAVLLLIASASAAALFLVRAESRGREIAVRYALGAHRHHVARLFFVEALALTVTAAALGLVLAHGILSAVIAWAPIELPRIGEIRLNPLAVAFAGGVAVVMALCYGVLSVRRQGRSTGVGLVSGGSWSTGTRAARAMSDPLIVLQVALALTLMAGSALMVKTYRNLSQRELGFSSDRVLTVEVGLPYRLARDHTRIFHALVERVRTLPGVESAAAASFVPLTASEHLFPAHAGSAPIPFKFFTPGYFETMGTPVLEGASLAPGEPVTAPYPVLVSAALARRLYPGERAIGRTVQRLNEDGTPVEMFAGATRSSPRLPVPPFTIAGVVADVRETTLRGDPAEIVYIPVIEPRVEQSIVPTNMNLVLRARVPPLSLVAAVRQTVASVEPGLSVGQVRSMDSIVRSARSREAFVGALLLAAAVISLFLGVVGIYGSVAHNVGRRTREIGVRLALGARRAEVVWMVAAGSMRATIIGAVLGLAAALAATQALRSLLFGVDASDPAALLAVTGLLLSAAIASALLAALRAARVEPILALRGD